MDNRLARVQLREVADQRIRINGTSAVLTTPCYALSQQIAFADQRQVVQRINKPVLGRPGHQITTVAGGFAQAQNALRCNFNTAQQFA